MAGGGKEKRTGADEAGNIRGPGRPPGPPLSEEEKKNKKKEKNIKDREYRAKKTSQLKEYEAFCGEPGIADLFKAFREKKEQEFKEELKQLEEYLMDGTNKDKMLTGNLAGSSNVASNCEGELQSSTTSTMPLTAGSMNSAATGGIVTPFEPPIRQLKRKREREPAEAPRGKMPATADNYTPPPLPIGGSRPSGLMADARQTARQSALPFHSSWKVAQQNEEPRGINLHTQKQHVNDTYVAKCPSSHGLDETQLPQLDVPSWTTVVMPRMGSLEDPGSLGFHCRKRAPHESCYTEVVISKMLDQMSGMQERLQRLEDNISAQIQRFVVAALAPFGSCLQANAPIVSPTEPHHDPLGMQGGTNAAAGSSGGSTTQSFPHNEEFQLKECQAFCEEPGISTDMFTAFREKNEQEFKEELKKLDEVLMKDGTNEFSDFDVGVLLSSPDHGMCTGYFADIGYCERELQSSTTRTTPLAAGAMNSTAARDKPHHDPLAMRGGTTAVGSSGGPTTQSSPHK